MDNWGFLFENLEKLSLLSSFDFHYIFQKYFLNILSQSIALSFIRKYLYFLSYLTLLNVVVYSELNLQKNKKRIPGAISDLHEGDDH